MYENKLTKKMNNPAPNYVSSLLMCWFRAHEWKKVNAKELAIELDLDEGIVRYAIMTLHDEKRIIKSVSSDPADMRFFFIDKTT